MSDAWKSLINVETHHAICVKLFKYNILWALVLYIQLFMGCPILLSMSFSLVAWRFCEYYAGMQVNKHPGLKYRAVGSGGVQNLVLQLLSWKAKFLAGPRPSQKF